mmetsp:Transcript_42733/g.48560  ORF Transcript_42733/g.48560 Transcript_42733/m.48560 type:complete len:168 (+) Transcript_42733:53-556(+)
MAKGLFSKLSKKNAEKPTPKETEEVTKEEKKGFFCKLNEKNAEKFKAQEEAVLTPPSKIMDASIHAQHLVMIVKRVIELKLGKKDDNLKATQMITRSFTNCSTNTSITRTLSSSSSASIYFIKVKTSSTEWPWIFVKIYEPPVINTVSKVILRDMKKMKEEFGLITF